MPGCARKDIVREGEIAVYHVWSRCVQKAFLLGDDPESGKNFDYRREWAEKLLQYQARLFAVDVGNYTILSNHKHGLLRTRPDIVTTWSDEEVAWRWKSAWPKLKKGEWVCEPTDEAIEELLADSAKILWIRGNLSSLSWFMARWKEPLARVCNAEMNTKGHFWEARYDCREIEGAPAALACSLYLDLNQPKAGMALAFEDCSFSGIQRRIKAWQSEQAQASLRKFQAQAHPGQHLDRSTMECLLADCFLAPIGEHGVLMTSPMAITNVSADPPASVVEQGSTEPTPPPASSVAATSPSRRPFRESKGRRQHKPSRKIHHRLRQRLRQRASDNAFLACAPVDYFRLAEWALDNWQNGGSKDSRFRPPDWPPQLASAPPKHDNFYRAIDEFQQQFFHMVGPPAAVEGKAARVGRRWLHGIRVCRDTFP